MKLLNFLKRKHRHKVKEEDRHDFFRYFGKDSPVVWENPFSKLKNVIDKKEELTVFQELSETAEKINRHQKWITFNTSKKSKKEEQKTIIKKLREIVEKK